MNGELTIRDLGTGVPFDQAVALQMRLHAARIRDDICDTLLLLEHAPVFTLGRSGRLEHVLWDERLRRQRGVALSEATRGGDVTYHGPGQLVGYPILKLGPAARRVVAYVERIEDVLLGSAADFGVTAKRDVRNRGIWVEEAKLAAIGIRVSSGVTLHGFALNVRVDLGMYAGIVPCGLRDTGVTSLHCLAEPPPGMTNVKQSVVENFRRVFGYETVTTGSADGGL